MERQKQFASESFVQQEELSGVIVSTTQKHSSILDKVSIAPTTETVHPVPASCAEPVPVITSNGASTESIKPARSNMSSSIDDATLFNIDNAQPLDTKSFPNQPRSGSSLIPVTIPNVAYLLQAYGISSRYNVVNKKLLIIVPGCCGAPDNADNVALTQIFSLAALNGLSTGQIPAILEAIGDRNQFNPVADWITSKNWDGVDRFQDICETLIEREGFPVHLKQQLLHRWLISTVAAALMPSGFKARGVLTLQGAQAIGKTSWISSLIPDAVLRESAMKLDHHMDGGNKDSHLTAICHWIVEIGELDSSFKKDIARLKGFLTSDRDKVRRPYGRADSEYPRRTVFCASVNDSCFLVDTTGNSRWWAIPVTQINFKHGIDMQQLFAQLAVDFHAGEQWWLTKEEEELLEEQNKKHRSVSVIRELIMGAINLDAPTEATIQSLTPMELLKHIDHKYPTNAQCKECAAILREYFGEPKRINGQNKWRVPLAENKEEPFSPHLATGKVRRNDSDF